MAEIDSGLSFSFSNKKGSPCTTGNDMALHEKNANPGSFANVASSGEPDKERQSAFKRAILRFSSRKKKPKVVEVATNHDDANGGYNEHCDEENESVSPLSSGGFWRSFRKKKKKIAPEPSLESSVAYTITEEATLTRDLRSSYKNAPDDQSTSFLVSTESANAKDNFESKDKSRKVKTSFWKLMFLRKSKIKSKDREPDITTNKDEESVVTTAMNNTHTSSTVTVEFQKQPEASPKDCSKSIKASMDLDTLSETQDKQSIASATYIAKTDEKSTQEEDKSSVLEFVTLSPKGARTPTESKPEKVKKHSSRHHSSRDHSSRNRSSRHHKKHSRDHKRQSKSHEEKTEVKNEEGSGLGSLKQEETSKPAVPPRMVPPKVPPRSYLHNDPEPFSRSKIIQITTPSLQKEKKTKLSKMLKFERSHTEVKDRDGIEDNGSVIQISSFKRSKAKNSIDDLKGNEDEEKPTIPALHVTPTNFERKPKKSSGFHLSIWKGQVLLLCHCVKH